MGTPAALSTLDTGRPVDRLVVATLRKHAPTLLRGATIDRTPVPVVTGPVPLAGTLVLSVASGPPEPMEVKRWPESRGTA